jgi:hypothetical protein
MLLSLNFVQGQTTFTETFENFETGWQKGATNKGDNDFNWTLDGNVENNKYENSNKGIRHKAESGTFKTVALSQTLSGGISEISVVCRNIWANPSVSRSFEILINNNVVHTESFADQVADPQPSTGVLRTVTASNLDISGEFVIEIRVIAPEGLNIGFDTITWTTKESVSLSKKDENFKNSIEIYPNPVNDILMIKNSANLSLKNVALFNVLGNQVYKSLNTKSINVSNFSKGLYILKIQSSDNIILTKKIVLK